MGTRRRARFTLIQLFVAGTVGVALVAAVALLVLVASSRRAIVERTAVLRDAEAQRVGARITAELGAAGDALDDLERGIGSGAIHTDDDRALEAALFAGLENHPTLSDIAFTHAQKLGFDPGGDATLATDGRWQLTLFRAGPDAGSAIITRRTTQEGGAFVADVRRRPAGGVFDSGSVQRDASAVDPTRHATFEVTVSKPFFGKAIWSDLHYSELDASLPAAERRVVVTVQKAVNDRDGHFAGVIRVGLLTRTIDALPRSIERQIAGEAGASARVFLCDAQGRLVARPSKDDALALSGDDLRVKPRQLAPAVARALSSSRLREVDVGAPRSDSVVVDGARLLVAFRALPHTQGWIVGVVVPEAYYTRDLTALRDRFLVVFGALALLVLGLGGVALKQLHGGLGAIRGATSRMRALDFAPSNVESPFRDVGDVMIELERAKTSMRALGKYAPMDLVRELYRSNREPTLGGELREISLMFSDIEGFTSLAERLEPGRLAEALGSYLEAMTSAVRSTSGTVDKFIGDAVMAFWNAPEPAEDHAKRACRAVLACMAATRKLYASPQWGDLPPLFTRFGVHTATVMVGHFGAPERLSYTALGDGVNLAARLEALCKQYGVAALVSGAVVGRVGDEIAFRRVDRVAVKGKTEAVDVYELLGPDADRDAAREYERAFALYLARDFHGALGALDEARDPPARVLAARCRHMLAEPPPETWDGVFVATTK